MIKQQISIHLGCPVEQVFAYVTDASKLRTWQSGLIENDPLSGAQLEVGTRFREVRRLNGRATEIQGEITQFEPNKRFATKTLAQPQATVVYTFDPEEDGSRLTYEFALQTSGFMRLLEPLIASSIKKESAVDLENLKRILEC